MPPFAYYGGKTTLAPQIAALLPPHDHYVEPFAGSLAVLLAKDPVGWETVNDLDGDLVTFWRVLRDRPEELARVAMLTPHSRAEYAASVERDLEDTDEVERARRVWVQLTQGRSHSMRHTGWWYGRKVRTASPPRYLNAYVSRMEAAAKRLARVSIENRDGVEVIRDYGQEPGVCIYADPPYLGSTRASNYGVEMLTDGSHTALADALKACQSTVVLSGYDSPLYTALFPTWHRTELEGPTNLGKSTTPEVLWSNVPLGVQGVLDFGGVVA